MDRTKEVGCVWRFLLIILVIARCLQAPTKHVVLAVAVCSDLWWPEWCLEMRLCRNVCPPEGTSGSWVTILILDFFLRRHC